MIKKIMNKLFLFVFTIILVKKKHLSYSSAFSNAIYCHQCYGQMRFGGEIR